MSAEDWLDISKKFAKLILLKTCPCNS